MILASYKKDYVAETEYLNLFYTDILESRRIVLDGNGEVTDKFIYSDFGEVNHVIGANDELASFTGKSYDDTGFIYFNARYYDPTLCRFITEDPSKKGINHYVYCDNNPINNVDYDGRMSRSDYEDSKNGYDSTGKNDPNKESIGNDSSSIPKNVEDKINKKIDNYVKNYGAYRDPRTGIVYHPTTDYFGSKEERFEAVRQAVEYNNPIEDVPSSMSDKYGREEEISNFASALIEHVNKGREENRPETDNDVQGNQTGPNKKKSLNNYYYGGSRSIDKNYSKHSYAESSIECARNIKTNNNLDFLNNNHPIDVLRKNIIADMVYVFRNLYDRIVIT